MQSSGTGRQGPSAHVRVGTRQDNNSRTTHSNSLSTAFAECQAFGVSLSASGAYGAIAACQQVVTALGLTMQAITDAELNLTPNLLVGGRIVPGAAFAPTVSTSSIVLAAQNVQNLIIDVLRTVNLSENEIGFNSRSL